MATIHLVAHPKLVVEVRPAYVETLCGVWMPLPSPSVSLNGSTPDKDVCPKCDSIMDGILRSSR